MRRFLDFTIRTLVVAALCAGLLSTAVLISHSSPQTSFLVSNTNDSGPGSLRQAILNANSTPGEDVIHINTIGTVNLLSALPTITEAVTISVEDAHALRIFIVNAQNSYRGLTITSVPVTISGLIVQNGVAFGTSSGGGIRSEGNLTLNNVHVLNSSAWRGGGVGSDGSVVVNGGRYEGNSASNDGGGAIYAEGALTVNGSIIQNNHCTTSLNCHGGGLYAGNTLTVANTEIMSNTAAGLGGGLFADGAVVITGTLFISNTTTSSGGGATITGIDPVQVTNSRFENNSSDNIGGGLADYSADTTTLNNVDFVGNDAYQAGGLNSGDVIINGGRFEGNTASATGGGLYAFNVVLTDTHFISNTAGAAGGALVNRIAATTGGSFAYNAGGGLVALGMVLTGTQFLNNSGGPAARAATSQATNVLFANNSHDAIRSFSETMIADSQFVNNGRGIVVQGPLTVTNSLFTNNTLGGVAQYDAGDVLIVNTLIASNSASEGGTAVSLQDSGTATLKHVTIASSELVNSPAISTTKEVLLIQNTIVANHAIGLNVTTGLVILRHTLFHDNGLDIQGTIAADENRVTGDPLFVNPGAEDFHLQSGSPAIDAGLDAGIVVDFEGDERPSLDGFDVGYDEFVLIRVLLPIIMR